MEEVAQSIYDVIQDYRNQDGIYISTSNIISWGEQFGNDAEFVLNELSHLLPQVYISRRTAKNYIKVHVDHYVRKYSYSSIAAFLSDTEFVNMQAAHKSQSAILSLLEEVLGEQYGESRIKYLTFPKRHFIYFDDLLASGSTIGNHAVQWLQAVDAKGRSNHDKIMDGEITFSISLFCCHTWGLSFQQYRISRMFSSKLSNRINWRWDYEVQNHAKFNNQRLNVAKPMRSIDPIVNTYFGTLTATKYEDYAFRELNTPAQETFFSSPDNRIKFENILLLKGIEIINRIKGDVRPNIRPLGLINPGYKVLGLGTHFFTWRNIPNNSPLVYWWEVPGHNWQPLFSVANRGN
ncbi:phosphoribosyltransferase-like protein [Chitinophaga rhizophila]|uniref:PRTase-CE domain-containing protein n=1 Tax=Chitinophaga rhizophila TaxID=2866212 RepID=A0ABS7GJ63_9BACT|nr:hypothetical protein [Chitinophaga rhizophila]MBW8687745.1 hypothetical protein [Chitinophaga rhizophila]